MNILLLHLFARSAHTALAGAVLDVPRWYRPMLVIPFRAGRRKGHLVAALESPGPFVHVHGERPLEGAVAPELFAALAGRRVAAVSSPPRDRVLRVDVEAGPGPTDTALSLEFHLYGSQATVQLTRGDVTLESVGGRRRPEGPGGRRPSLVDIDTADLETALAAAASGPGADAGGVRAAVPGLDAPLAAALAAPDGGVDTSALIAFRDGLLAGDTAFELASNRRPAHAVPIPAAHGAAHGGAAENGIDHGVDGEEATEPFFSSGPFTSALEATSAVGEVVLEEAKRGIIRSLSRPIAKHLASQEKLRENLGHDLSRALGHERMRREAETLAAYQSTIRPGAETVELPDVYNPDTTVRITLDPALSVASQIEKRFRKATKLEKSEAHARRRIELVEGEIRELRAALEVVERAGSFAIALTHLQTIRSRHGLDAVDHRAPARGRAVVATTPFRRFDLGQGWIALVGKSSRDNDELTFRHAAPADLWLHAQSVPGSHVILKSPGPETPPPAILQAAAGLAAHYSRARHSGLVPVIYTRRKYVRKFRGARAGQVRCEREKMVMAEPRLPRSTGEVE
jgi:hypothetical protein